MFVEFIFLYTESSDDWVMARRLYKEISIWKCRGRIVSIKNPHETNNIIPVFPRRRDRCRAARVDWLRYALEVRVGTQKASSTASFLMQTNLACCDARRQILSAGFVY